MQSTPQKITGFQSLFSSLPLTSCPFGNQITEDVRDEHGGANSNTHTLEEIFGRPAAVP